MRRTNRINPIVTERDVADVTRATMTTTTRMEFVRQVQVLPMVRTFSMRHFFEGDDLHVKRDFSFTN